MDYLAECLAAQGDFAGARDLFRETLVGMKRVIGAEHPTTVETGEKLKAVLQQQQQQQQQQQSASTSLAADPSLGVIGDSF
jgi:hypothetical protein